MVAEEGPGEVEVRALAAVAMKPSLRSESTVQIGGTDPTDGDWPVKDK